MKEAMKLALEALKNAHSCTAQEYDNAVKALEEALAKQEQGKPVAYFNPQVKGGFYWAKPTKITAPITVSVEPMPLYTTPQQRTWVGLEAEDRLCAKYMQDAPDGIETVIDYIEAKLKEKNT